MMSQSSSLKQFNSSVCSNSIVQLKRKTHNGHKGDSKYNKSHQMKMGIVTCTRQCDGKKLVILIC